MSTPELTTLSPKTITALGELLRTHRAGFKDDMERIVGKMGGTAAGGFVGGRGTVGGSLSDQNKELALLIKHLGKVNANLSAYDKYLLDSARKQQKSVLDRIKAEEDAKKATDDNTDEKKKNSNAIDENSKSQDKAKETIKDFTRSVINGTIAVKGFQHLVDEMRTSYKLGMKWDPVSDALAGIKMGMNPKEMMEFQAQFRRTSGALAGGMQEFNNTVSANQTQMVQYTGSMKAAAMAMGNMYEISHSMGLNLSDVGNSADSLFVQFKKMNAATSLTIDQFTDLTKSLIDDGDIRSKLLSLQTQQRSVYIQSLLKQQDVLQAQGMTFEAAQKFVKFVESNSNKSPLERMKQGAQLMMFAKSMGMSTKDANEFMILNNARNKTPEQMSRFKELGVDVTTRAHQRMNTGPMLSNGINQGDIITNTMLEKMGLNLSSFDDAALQQSATRDPASIAKQTMEIQQRSDEWLQKIYKQSTIVADIMGGWTNAAIGVAVGGLALAFINRKGGLVDRMLDRFLGGRPPVPPGPPGPPPGPPVPPGGGGWRGRLAGAAGRAGAGGLIAMGGIAAGGMIDPSQFSEENQGVASIASNALQFGGAGAGLGFMVGGPMGAAAGAALGILAGTAKALYDKSKDYQGEAMKIMGMNTAMQSADEARIIGQREQTLMEIDVIKAHGDLTDAQKKTVEELTKKVEGLNNELSKEQQQTQMAMIGALGPAGQALLKGSVDSTGDLRERASSLDMLANQAGLSNTNSMKSWIGAAYAQASKQGASSSEFAALSKFAGAADKGGDMSMPSELKKFFDPAGADTLASLQRMGGSQYSSILGGMDSKGLSSFVSDSATKAQELDKQIADLEQKRKDAAASTSWFDETGMAGMGEALKIDKQLAEARAMKENQIKMAQGLESALNGSQSLSTRFDDDSLAALANLIKGIKPAAKSNAANTGN